MSCQSKAVKQWVDEMIELCQPDKVVADGSEEERTSRRRSLNGEMQLLDQKMARLSLSPHGGKRRCTLKAERSFVLEEEDAGPTNHCRPKEMYEK